MKKIIYFIGLNILINLIAFSQETDDVYYTPADDNNKLNLKTIPKDTWKILIYTNKNQEDNYKYIGTTLLEENFQIDKANKDFYAITTVPKAHDRLDLCYILNFVSKDSLVILTGTYKLNVTIDLGMVESESSFAKIKNRGQNGSPIRESFRQLMNFALKLSAIENMKFINE